MRSSAPSGSPSQYTDPKQIDAILKSSDPGAVAEAGRSYQKFAHAYEEIAQRLLSVRDDLSDAWAGEDAAAAQAQLREVWSAATTIHKTADTFGSTIERHGSEYLGWYKDNKPPSTSLAEAQSWMTGANERVSQSWSSLPPDLSTTLPPGGDRQRLGSADSGSGAGAGGSAGGTSGGAGLGGGHIPGSAGHLPKDSAGVGGTRTDLAGFSSPNGGPAAGIGTPPGGIGGGTPSPISSGGAYGSGAVPPGGIVGLGAGNARTPGSPAGGRPLAAASEAGAEAEAAEAAAGARAGGAVGSVAGGRGAEERERRRGSWHAEDEDVWTGDLESGPEVIGAVEPPSAEEKSAASTDLTAESDLADDDDELVALLAELRDDTELRSSADGPDDISVRITELREQLARLERQRDAESGIPSPPEQHDSGRDWLGGDGL